MRIFLVDDQAEMRVLMRHWLTGPQWEVLEASSGEEALERRGEPFDVMVIDHLMRPGISGLEVARTLRESGDERPIIVCTAFLPPPLEAEAAAMNVAVAVKEDFPALVRRLEELATPDP
jgi:CheY-like chemotaxis protein